MGSHDVQRQRTSKKELDDIRALVARDLADATVAGLSADRRFATAYNAALLAANMAIARAGYRVTAKTGHHKISFDSIKLALDAGAEGQEGGGVCFRRYECTAALPVLR